MYIKACHLNLRLHYGPIFLFKVCAVLRVLRVLLLFVAVIGQILPSIPDTYIYSHTIVSPSIYTKPP
jgi:hypothetical protein